MIEKAPKPSAPFKKEREFHTDRWETDADAVNKQLREQLPHGAGFAIPNEELITGYDAMLNEADREDADFEKRQHTEFLEWQKTLRVVIEHFKERAENPESTRRTLIFVASGGMQVANAAGQLAALNLMGLTADKVDTVVGASSGAMAATAYVSGPEGTKKGAAMLTGPLASKEFIDPSISRLGETVKLRMAQELMEEGVYKIDQDSIRNSQTELAFVVTLPVQEGEDPEPAFLNAKTIPSMTDGIVSSMSIPYATGKIPEINGQTFFDGGFSPLPLKQLIEKFNPTDILILPQTPFELMENIKPSPTESTIASIAGATGIGQLEKGLLLKQQWRKSLERIGEETDVNIAIAWAPDSEMTLLTTKGSSIKAAFLAAGQDLFKQLGEEPREEMFEYLSPEQTQGEDLKEAA